MHNPSDALTAGESAALSGGAQAPPASERRLGPQTRISIVVPCYNEQAVLPLLFDRLQGEIARWGTDYEVILIDDGSRDLTWELMTQFHRRDPRWKMIRFARNFGHQTALRVGLEAVTGDVVAVLDADLQDPPEVLPKFFAKWAEGYDVIYGVRRDRKEGLIKRTAYYWFYRVLSLLAEQEIALDAGDFSVMDRRIVELLKAMPERKPFIRGLRAWVGYPQTAVPYDRQRRAAGVTKYSFRRLVGLAADGILSSSIVPLRVAAWLGAIVSVAAFFGAMFTIIVRIFESQFERLGLKPVEGTVTILASVLFLGGVQLLFLGILGEYIGRIYENIKGRPFSTIRETLGLDEPATGATSVRVITEAKSSAAEIKH